MRPSSKEKLKPGLYTTYSNLGTFYILTGEFEKGLPYIDKALEIDPNAHFGREKYQKWLVEYALTRMKDGKLSFPLGRMSDYDSRISFAQFLAERVGTMELSEHETNSAIRGVLGMMRFANHDNPLLLEALGDLLTASYDPDRDAKQLAARAFLRASYVVADPQAEEKFRERAEWALGDQADPRSRDVDQLPLSDLEADFTKELADADKWYAELKRRELDWIRAGLDVEAEFDKHYRQDPDLPQTFAERVLTMSPKTDLYAGLTVAFVVVSAIAAFKIWRRAVK